MIRKFFTDNTCNVIVKFKDKRCTGEISERIFFNKCHACGTVAPAITAVSRRKGMPSQVWISPESCHDGICKCLNKSGICGFKFISA